LGFLAGPIRPCCDRDRLSTQLCIRIAMSFPNRNLNYIVRLNHEAQVAGFESSSETA
jgi:hypothetical protein